MGVDRRAFLGTSTALLTGALVGTAQVSRGQSVGPATSTATDSAHSSHVTDTFIEWLQRSRYEDLPASVQHEAKRYLLDAIGCGLAGFKTDKANLSVTYIRGLGGRADARILGTRERVPASSAAFANGELINALDYDAIPHIPPLVVPPVMAVAELTRSSGKDVILAAVLGHEMSSRIAGGVGTMGEVLAARHLETPVPQSFGISNETIMASAAIASKLLKLDAEHTAFAIGLAGYFCSVPAAHNWETVTPMSMVKYTPMGWLCQGAVTAALLARDGYTGNQTVLDGKGNFAEFYSKKFWNPDAIVADLGQTWSITRTSYKPYACCRFMHAIIDCAIDLVRSHGIAAADIEDVYALGAEFGANPDMLNVRTQEDAQFSIPYMLAQVCSGHQLNAEVQDREHLNDPLIRALMKKIRWGVHPRNKVEIARVEITALGKTHVQEVTNVKGAPQPGYALTDDELTAKFLENASRRLGGKKARSAADLLWNLEQVKNFAQLMDQLVA